jgi:uncharacterized protein (TIGR02246 family)
MTIKNYKNYRSSTPDSYLWLDSSLKLKLKAMSNVTKPVSSEETAVRLIYHNLLQAWNNADAKAYAGLFAKEGNIIGFDGSQANTRDEIEAHLSAVFTNHKTGKYVSIVREVRFLTSRVAILRAVAGLVPPGQTDINPATNAVQTAVIQKDGDKYRISVFQNTPAAYHGRPEDAEKLTQELRNALELTKDV